MDYTNYQNPSPVEPRDFFNSTTGSPVTSRTVEPNRSESESTEQRLYGAYRNTDNDVRTLNPVSTPDAPLIYPLVDETNPDVAQEMNNQTEPVPVRMPDFTTATRTRDTTVPELYTPLGQKTSPATSYVDQNRTQPYTYTPNNMSSGINYQNDMNNSNNYRMYYNPQTSYPDLGTDYQMDNERNMYLPTRNTPYYNLPSNGYETLNDFEEAERDMEYLRQLYPVVWRLLQAEIDEECDKLEYEGSCIFDQYPDKVTLDRIIHSIYERVKDYDEFKNYDNGTTSNEVTANQVFFNPCPRCNWIEDFTRIMFLNEIHNRRRRHRNRRRWFY